MIRTTVWPRSWNSRSFRRNTVWPRWMSGAVGSIPSLTRSGRPSASCRSRAPSGSASTAFRSRKRASEASGSVTVAMLDSRPRRTELEARRRPVLRGPLVARQPYAGFDADSSEARRRHSRATRAQRARPQKRRRAEGPEAEAEEAAPLPRAARPSAAGGHLDAVRDADGGCQGDPVAREQRAVQGRAQPTMLAANGQPIARLTGNENR